MIFFKLFSPKALVVFSTFTITTSPLYAYCLSSNPELYDYSGSYTGVTQTTSLELVSNSGSKECKLISTDEIKTLGGDVLFIKGKGGLDRSHLTAKCENLLLNFYNGGKGSDMRLRVLPIGAQPEDYIEAEPNGWTQTRKEDGFGTISYDAVIIQKSCIKEGEWEQIDRKFKALTPKGEILRTRQLKFKWIKTN